MRFTIVAILVFMAMFASAYSQSVILNQCEDKKGNDCNQCCGKHGYDPDASVVFEEKNRRGELVEYCYCDDGLDD